MKLFEITNGWMGNSYVRVYVIAEDESEAIRLATTPFKNDGKRQKHPKAYWENLEVKTLCEDTSKPWCGEASDE